MLAAWAFSAFLTCSLTEKQEVNIFMTEALQALTSQTDLVLSEAEQL